MTSSGWQGLVIQSSAPSRSPRTLWATVEGPVQTTMPRSGSASQRRSSQVLSKRLDRLGWEHRVLASPVPTDTVVSMRLSALVVDLAVLGPQAWTWQDQRPAPT